MTSDNSDDPAQPPDARHHRAADAAAFRRRIEERLAESRARRAAEDEEFRRQHPDFGSRIRAELARRMDDPAERAKMEAAHARSEEMFRARQPRPLQPGEELRWFRSSDESWQHLAGRSGYEIVKDGKVIERVVLFMN